MGFFRKARELDRDLFRTTLADEISVAWKTLSERHQGEDFYAFGLYTTPLGESQMVTASTEEGLSRATSRYVEKYGDDPALRRLSLRWSHADSPLHDEGVDLLPESGALLAAGPDPYDESPEAEAAVSLVFEVAAEVLVQLDRRATFGADPGRFRIVLGIWTTDQSDEEKVQLVRPLNPVVVAARYERELQEALAAFFALSRTRRGRVS
jgi:hypothetical protein